jgi:monofunctional biosynthetic peptidoglycan transglycosylase
LQKRGLAKRLFRWLAWMVAAWVLVSVLLVLALRWVNPPTTAFIAGARVQAWLDDKPLRVRHEWVDYSRISRQAPLAVIAAEDQKFPYHWGFDFASIDASLRDHSRGRRLRGASTISQQVAKNLFLWKRPTLVRKGFEAWFTLLIESLWPKQRILEVYLNVAELGPGIYGVGAASRHYFRKPAALLTPEESALLAAVLPNPQRLRVAAPSLFVRTRQEWILWQMRGLGTGYLAGMD